MGGTVVRMYRLTKIVLQICRHSSCSSITYINWQSSLKSQCGSDSIPLAFLSSCFSWIVHIGSLFFFNFSFAFCLISLLPNCYFEMFQSLGGTVPPNTDHVCSDPTMLPLLDSNNARQDTNYYLFDHDRVANPYSRQSACLSQHGKPTSVTKKARTG